MKDQILSPQSKCCMGSTHVYIYFQRTSNVAMRGYHKTALRLDFFAETASKGNN